MPIVSTDLVFYAAANKPEDDTSTNGGAIDADTRIVFTDLAASDEIEVVSSNAGDTTQDCTIRARAASGEIITDVVSLNGTTPVVWAGGAVVRFLSATLDGDAAGIVTVRRDGDAGDIADIPVGERGVRRLFINASSAVGSAKTYYEKIFCKNNHATISLLAAAIVENADPSTKVAFCLAAAIDDTATSTNRITAPGAGDLLDPDTFGDASQSIPGGALAAGEAIGVWVRMSLDDGNAPLNTTWSAQASGTTT